MKYIILSFLLIIAPWALRSQIIYDYSYLPPNSNISNTSKVNHFLLNAIYDYGNYDNNIPIWILGDSRIKQFTYYDNGKMNNGVITYESSESVQYEYDNQGRLLSFKTVNNPIGNNFIELIINYDQPNKITFELNTDEEPERGYIKLDNGKIVEYFNEFKSSDGTWKPLNNLFYSDYDVCGNYTTRKLSTEGGPIKNENVTLAYNSINNCTMNKWQSISWGYNNQGILNSRNNITFELDNQNRVFKIPVGTSSIRRFDYNLEGRVSSVVIYNQTNRDSIAIEYADIQSSLNQENDKININVYPNPTSQTLTIQVEESFIGSLNFKLFNSNYQMVSEGKLMTSINQIDISKYFNGIYFLQISGKNGISFEKIIIE